MNNLSRFKLVFRQEPFAQHGHFFDESVEGIGERQQLGFTLHGRDLGLKVREGLSDYCAVDGIQAVP